MVARESQPTRADGAEMPGPPPQQAPRARLAGGVVGAAAGLATLVFPTVGWLVVGGFIVGAVIARGALRGVGAMLAAMGLVWGSLLIANGVQPDLLGWLLTAAAMFLVGGGLLVADRWRARRRGAEGPRTLP